MLGVGTKMATTADRDFPVLLDVTRLTSRVGRGAPTGIDRVELAYLEWCLATSEDLWGFARVAGGFVLLDRAGLASFYSKIIGDEAWGTKDIRARIGLRTPAARGAAESDLRRLAIGRPVDLLEAVQSISEPGLKYLNVGHSNLRAETLGIGRQKTFQTIIFLHDAIPLDHPEFQTAESVKKFKAKAELVKRGSDLVITNSEASADRLVHHGICDASAVHGVHLGVMAEQANLIKEDQNRPYFVVLGTIEPRKNHELLLDIWEELGPAAPRLHVVGHRGWADPNLFRRLDQLVVKGCIEEHSNLADHELWPLISGAQALLFPSHAEGFGLPTLEAAALGTPVVCGDLAIHRELLGAYPVYLDTRDRYRWKQRIIELAEQNLDVLRAQCANNRPNIPTWEAHFERVNQVIMGA